MLKDKILESFDRINYSVNRNEISSAMDIKLRGYVEITGKRNGVIVYHDEGPNHVTYGARHALMQLIRGNPMSRFGRYLTTAIPADGEYLMAISKRSAAVTRSGSNNPDATLVSGQTYWYTGDPYYDTTANPAPAFFVSQNKHFYGGTAPTDAYYSNFPTKILFGTGVEFERFDVTNKTNTKLSLVHKTLNSNKRTAFLASGNIDAISTLSPIDFNQEVLQPYLAQFNLTSNVITDLETFNSHMDATSGLAASFGTASKVPNINTYSAIYKTSVTNNAVYMTKARTVNDIFTTNISDFPTTSSSPQLKDPIGLNSWEVELSDDIPYYSPTKNNQTTAITGAIKTSVISTLVTESDASRGMGLPCFIYVDQNAGKQNFSGTNPGTTEYGTTLNKSNDKETKITFTVLLPKQTTSTEYYPYNGYTLKEIGLFNDAFLVKRQDTGYKVGSSAYPFLGYTSPTDDSWITTDGLDGSSHAHMKSGFGTMWAARKIRPIYKDWDLEIEVKWSIYFDES
jgi:hypothetical protein